MTTSSGLTRDRPAGVDGGLSIVKMSGDLLDRTTSIPRLRPDLATNGLVVVAGCGRQFTETMRRRGAAVEFRGGRRCTPPDTLSALARTVRDVTERLTVALQQDLGRVVVPGERLLTAHPVEDPQLGSVGYIAGIDIEGVVAQLAQRRVLLIGPIIPGARGYGHLNVNADEIAASLAVGLEARDLTFCTPFQGVRGRDGRTCGQLSLDQATQLVDDGIAHGGMALKLRQACVAARSGCPARIIGNDLSMAGTTVLPSRVSVGDGSTP